MLIIQGLVLEVQSDMNEFNHKFQSLFRPEFLRPFSQLLK